MATMSHVFGSEMQPQQHDLVAATEWTHAHVLASRETSSVADTFRLSSTLQLVCATVSRQPEPATAMANLRDGDVHGMGPDSLVRLEERRTKLGSHGPVRRSNRSFESVVWWPGLVGSLDDRLHYYCA